MKKEIVSRILITIMVFSILAFIVVCFTACNKQPFDTTYSFDKAILVLPNGEVIEGEVQSWTDFDDGDQIQVKIDGKTYLVHSSNIVLISE